MVLKDEMRLDCIQLCIPVEGKGDRCCIIVLEHRYCISINIIKKKSKFGNYDLWKREGGYIVNHKPLKN